MSIVLWYPGIERHYCPRRFSWNSPLYSTDRRTDQLNKNTIPGSWGRKKIREKTTFWDGAESIGKDQIPSEPFYGPYGKLNVLHKYPVQNRTGQQEAVSPMLLKFGDKGVNENNLKFPGRNKHTMNFSPKKVSVIPGARWWKSGIRRWKYGKVLTSSSWYPGRQTRDVLNTGPFVRIPPFLCRSLYKYIIKPGTVRSNPETPRSRKYKGRHTEHRESQWLFLP